MSNLYKVRINKILNEDHLRFDDMPEAAQELKIDDMKGWIARNGGKTQVAIFRNVGNTDMYIEEFFDKDEDLVDMVSQICKTLKKTTPGE